MLKRTVISIFMLLLVTAVLVFRDWLFVPVMVLFATVCNWEICRAFRGAGYPVQPWTSIAFGILMVPAIFFRGIAGGFVLYMFMTALSLVLLFFRKEYEFKDALAAIFLMFYPNMGYMAYMLVHTNVESNLATYAIGMSLFGAGCTDIFAYLGGRTFGKTKLAPMISPNKTVEGFLCGIVGGLAASVLFWYILGLCGLHPGINILQTLGLGLIASLMGQLGDLLASLIKRGLGIKDFGKILGPQGGLLDRMDSSLMTVIGIYTVLVFMVI